MLDEAGRRQDRASPGCDVLDRRDTLDATEVIDVAVGVDHRGDRAVTAMRPIQRETRRSGLRGDQWIDDDHAGIALDERHVRQVQTAHLVDTLRDLEQSLPRAESRLPPEARIHRRRAVVVEECVRIAVPHDVAIGVPHDPGFESRDETAIDVVEILDVREGQ
ncbi:hypothetical protein RDE2_28560 [Rhodococcus sp. RDE2]|nr:hypothetical protein RDE2_28560 [Rhodococcus sp. RDE2]